MLSTILSAIAAFLSFSFAAYLLTGSKRSQDRYFAAAMFALAAIEAADRLSLSAGFSDWELRQASQVLEAFAALLLLLFSHLHARSAGFRAMSKTWLAGLAVVCATPFVILATAGNDLFYSPDLLSEEVLFLGSAGYWFYLVLMGMYIAAIVQTERTFVATHGSDRYRIKLEIIGVMSLYAVMIFYYSHSLLYRTINMNLLPVRSGVLIVVVVLTVFSRIMRGSSIQVSLSRHVYYRSVALLVIGVYLLVLGLIGEGMKYIGYEGGSALIIFMAFAGGIAVLVAILSEKMRRVVKVLVSKHFFATKYDYRESWLRFTDSLASCKSEEELWDAIRNTFRETFGLEYVLLFISTGDGWHFNETVPQQTGQKGEAIRISYGLQRYFIDKNRVWNPRDSEYRPEPEERSIAETLAVNLMVPLINNDKIEGLIVFKDRLIPEAWIYEDYDLMKSLGRQAAQALANTRLADELMESHELAAVSRVSSFVIHDLKNLTTSLSVMVDNAREHMGNPDFQKDAVETLHVTVEKMKRLIQRLKPVPEKETLQCRNVDLDRLVGRIVGEFSAARPRAQIRYHGEQAFAQADQEEIQKVVTNMLLNAVDASDGQGTITVETRTSGDAAVLRIADEGQGMSREFIRTQLFRPFRSTKSKGLGIGLYQCKQIIEAHGGRIEVQSTEGKGAVFTIRLPHVTTAS